MAQVQMAATQLHSATFNEMHEQSQFALISNEANTAEIEETKDENSDRYIVKDQEMVQVNRNIGEFTVEIKTGVSRGWGSIIVWGTVDLEQSEQRKKDRR